MPARPPPSWLGGCRPRLPLCCPSPAGLSHCRPGPHGHLQPTPYSEANPAPGPTVLQGSSPPGALVPATREAPDHHGPHLCSSHAQPTGLLSPSQETCTRRRGPHPAGPPGSSFQPLCSPTVLTHCRCSAVSGRPPPGQLTERLPRHEGASGRRTRCGATQPRCLVNPGLHHPSASPCPHHESRACRTVWKRHWMLTHKEGSSFKKSLQPRQGPRLPSPLPALALAHRCHKAEPNQGRLPATLDRQPQEPPVRDGSAWNSKAGLEARPQTPQPRAKAL